MSVEEAKRNALERAKIQAIADEFGTVVSQSTSTVMTNQNGKTDSHFFATGGSEVKGEWIETIGEPKYDLKFEDHFLVVTCSIKGKAREITQAKIEFIAKPLRNGTTLKYESTEFRNGDDLYLYFRSPVSGYLYVYLLDNTNKISYTLLPYRKSNGNPLKVDANQEYIFFSRALASTYFKNEVDEYQLTSKSHNEVNTLYIIFSNNILPQMQMKKSIQDFPIYSSYEDFINWTTSLKRNYNTSIKEIVILISNL
ncbi:MAG: DUF4384 domain-containing protein [Bacteroides sp.]|nr:DUF4384 domain-containing protein [Bacteroides sp.]